MQSAKRSKHEGLANISKNSDSVAKYYDTWSGDYDETLAEWRYDAPEDVASILQAELSPESVILDAGCGTGLSGKALRSVGFEAIDGIDVSSQSLKIAEASGAYKTLRAVDMQHLPLPVSDDRYDGLTCVGVLTYLTDSIGTLREFCRIVRPGGLVVFTQRSDLFTERKFDGVLEELSDEGRIEQVRVSSPRPYLPENEEFGDKILVHYITCKVR